jgi:hypothetical protein
MKGRFSTSKYVMFAKAPEIQAVLTEAENRLQIHSRKNKGLTGFFNLFQ